MATSSAESKAERERLRSRFQRQTQEISPQPATRPTWEYFPNHPPQSPPASRVCAPTRTSSGDWKVEGWSDNWREDVDYHNRTSFERVAGWPSTWRQDLARMYGYGTDDAGLMENQDQGEEAGDVHDYGDYEQDEDNEPYGSDYDKEDSDDDDSSSEGSSETESETDNNYGNNQELNRSDRENDVSPRVKFPRGLPKLDFPQTLLEDHTMTVIIQNRRDPTQHKTYIVEKTGVVERSMSGSDINTSTWSSPAPSVIGAQSPGATSKQRGGSKHGTLGNGLVDQTLKKKSSLGVSLLDSPEEYEWKDVDELLFRGRRRGGQKSISTTDSLPKTPPPPVAEVMKDSAEKDKNKGALVEEVEKEEELLIIL
ncbi:hypothetical protein QBC38DRAFT_21282 [Podospora fimiseda]|uniref:Uncharacterized protein n=1 Tax=Podospora fimiseda TaxID=252190 RepID=A0AAN7BW45_9PEZI|nr:hypothetical protein QBC38DRAFT_21282 [Podospora fimiseda]